MLTLAQLVNKFRVSFVYGTQRFTGSTVFTSSATEFNPLSETQTLLTYTLILSFHLRLPVVRGDFPSRFPANVVIHFTYPRACYMNHPSLPRFTYRNNVL
jgi:hypothetical protein